MKTILCLFTVAVAALGMSSCCSLSNAAKMNGEWVTETKQVKTCRYTTVTEEVYHPGPKGGTIELVEKKIPCYKTVTKRKWVSAPPCVRLYCPGKDDCGTTSEKTMLMATAQGPVGSPHIGLIPTMKPLAE